MKLKTDALANILSSMESSQIVLLYCTIFVVTVVVCIRIHRQVKCYSAMATVEEFYEIIQSKIAKDMFRRWLWLMSLPLAKIFLNRHRIVHEYFLLCDMVAEKTET